jgi:hypothetical protein
MIKIYFQISCIILLCSCEVNGTRDCILNEYEKSIQTGIIMGRVERKHIPKSNHGRLRIEIKNYTGSMVYHEQSMLLDNSFYEEVEIGDSIIKRKGFLDFIIVKPDGSQKLYQFYCTGVQHDSIR